jgi:hypothetical protein
MLHGNHSVNSLGKYYIQPCDNKTHYSFLDYELSNLQALQTVVVFWKLFKHNRTPKVFYHRREYKRVCNIYINPIFLLMISFSSIHVAKREIFLLKWYYYELLTKQFRKWYILKFSDRSTTSKIFDSSKNLIIYSSMMTDLLINLFLLKLKTSIFITCNSRCFQMLFILFNHVYDNYYPQLFRSSDRLPCLWFTLIIAE